MFSTSHLHPMLVHFPIALVMIGFLFELFYLFVRKDVCLTKMGYYLLTIGTLGALGAWLSGQLFTSDMAGSAEQIRKTHELLATITLGLLLITSILRTVFLWKKIEAPKLNQLAFALYGLAAIFVSITGFMGGTLVYNYMMPL